MTVLQRDVRDLARVIRRLPAWTGGLTGRIMRTPRLIVPDTGLLGYLAAVSVVAVEVKAAATIDGRAFRGIEAFRERTGKRLHRGIVLYGGREPLAIGPDHWALPIDALWRL